MVEHHQTSHSSHDNSCGVASVVFGIFSIFFASPPLYGVILGILSIVFGFKQQKYYANKWGKRGTILGIIGIVLSVVIYAILLWLRIARPDLLAQLNPAVLGTPTAQ